MKNCLHPTSQHCMHCPAHGKSPFKNLTLDQSSLIDKVRQFKKVSQNQVISHTDNQNAGFYCVLKGYFKISYKCKSGVNTLGISGPGDLLSYMTSDFYSAEALVDSEVCFFEADAFSSLQKSVPDISTGIILWLVKSIELNDRRVAGLETLSLKNRVASTLLSLMEKFGTSSPMGATIEAKIDRQSLACLSGTVVESLARILTELEDDKIILRQGRKICVVDPVQLQILASP